LKGEELYSLPFKGRVGERETGMANFIIKGGIFAMSVRQLMMHPSGNSRPIGFTADIGVKRK
jgi:hypothetical protein